MQLPEHFIERTQPLLNGEWQEFSDSLHKNFPVSIRLNPAKLRLINETDLVPVPWCKTGFYLDNRPSFTFDPVFHTGAYYVQEASSMFVGQFFSQYITADVKVLDLCAAPGGKSTHIASLISEDSLLVSNEVIKQRANILSENITKAGYPNVIVTNNDPSDFSKINSFFDVVLVDAPCSGEGMFRKDAGAVSEWSEANVKLCSERQRRIVADVWNSLKPGGYLIYSTCTFNTEENEDNVLWIKNNLEAEIIPLEVDPNWRISGSKSDDVDLPVYRFFPHKLNGEGFFMAVLRKNESEKSANNRKTRKVSNNKKYSLDLQYKMYLNEPDQFEFFNRNDSWFAFPTSLYNCFEEIRSQLNLISAGVYVGEVKGKDFIPHHSLAMSNYLNKNAFICFEVDKINAIKYLRKEALVFDNLPNGYILLTYKCIPLGFVKNIGNRANNLYPNEWRIRSSYDKDKEITLEW